MGVRRAISSRKGVVALPVGKNLAAPFFCCRAKGIVPRNNGNTWEHAHGHVWKGIGGLRIGYVLGRVASRLSLHCGADFFDLCVATSIATCVVQLHGQAANP